MINLAAARDEKEKGSDQTPCQMEREVGKGENWWANDVKEFLKLFPASFVGERVTYLQFYRHRTHLCTTRKQEPTSDQDSG
jgi:hypothetical protein